MKIKCIVLGIMLLMAAAIVNAATQEVQGEHLINDLTCVDCHDTDKPETRASQAKCIECHGDKGADKKALMVKDADGNIFMLDPHDSHSGTLRCTLCHMGHTTSVLYCNRECHTFDLKVP